MHNIDPVIQSFIRGGYYHWHLYQVDRHSMENSPPVAIFAHKMEAEAALDYLSDTFKTITFVLSDVDGNYDSMVG